MVRGAPYAPLGKIKTKSMLDLLEVKPGEKALDLGSGDGRIVIELAKRGAKAYGYEINPLLVWISRRNIKKAGLTESAFIIRKDYWRADFSDYKFVTIYGSFHIMKRLEKKLKKELPKNSRVVSNYFKFPNWEISKKVDTLYLYTKK